MTVRPAAIMTVLMLGLCCLLLTACGNKGGAGLIPATDSSALNKHLDDLQTAVDLGHCRVASRALDQLDTDLRSLPASVDNRLLARLQSGYEKLSSKASSECSSIAGDKAANAATTESTVDSVPTTTENTTPTTATTQPDKTTTPQDTTTDNGGVSPDQPTTTTPLTPPGGSPPSDQSTIGSP